MIRSVALLALCSLSFFARAADADAARAPRPSEAYVASGPREPRVRRIVFLHGQGWAARDACATVEREVRQLGPLLCPAANTDEGWRGTFVDALAPIRRAESAAEKIHLVVDPTRGPDETILAGHSNGAWMAHELATHRPGRFAALLLIGMDVKPNVAKLTANGVRRVALAAGRNDGAFTAMRESARNLDGATVRFFDLGDMGHWLLPDTGARLRDALQWLIEVPTTTAPASEPRSE